MSKHLFTLLVFISSVDKVLTRSGQQSSAATTIALAKQNEAASLKTENATLQNELATIKASIIPLKDENTKLKETIDKLTQENTSLKEANANLQTSIDKMSNTESSKATATNQENASLKASVTSLSDKNTTLENEAAILKKEITDLKEKNILLEKTNTELSSSKSTDGAELDKTKSKLAEYEAKIQTLSETNSKLEEEKKALLDNDNAVKESHSITETKVSELSNANEKLTQQLDEATEKLKTMQEQQQQSSITQVDKIKKTIDQLSNNLQNCTDIVTNNFISNIDSIKTSMNKLVEENKQQSSMQQDLSDQTQSNFEEISKINDNFAQTLEDVRKIIQTIPLIKQEFQAQLIEKQKKSDASSRSFNSEKQDLVDKILKLEDSEQKSLAKISALSHSMQALIPQIQQLSILIDKLNLMKTYLISEYSSANINNVQKIEQLYSTMSSLKQAHATKMQTIATKLSTMDSLLHSAKTNPSQLYINSFIELLSVLGGINSLESFINQSAQAIESITNIKILLTNQQQQALLAKDNDTKQLATSTAKLQDELQASKDKYLALENQLAQTNKTLQDYQSFMEAASAGFTQQSQALNSINQRITNR